MSGRRLFLDTNAIVALLQGNQELVNYTRGVDWIGVSIISQIEFFCFSKLTDVDRNLFTEFLTQIEVIGLPSSDRQLIDRTVEIRRTLRIRLPDAIIVASALTRNASLVTADRELLSIKDLPVLSFKP
jgi:predicted nucleic acid-binding protein